MNLRNRNIGLFIKKRNIKWEVRLLLLILIASVLSPIITNNKPLYCSLNGQSYYPAFNDVLSVHSLTKINGKVLTGSSNWQHLKYEYVVWPPFKHGALELDTENKDFQSPLHRSKNEIGESADFRSQHLFGTNRQGKDVLANVLGGIKYSLLIGISAVIIAACIGIFIGSIAGYYKNKFTIGKVELVGIIVFLFPAWFYSFSIRKYAISDAFTSGVHSGLIQLLFSLFLFSAICVLASKTGKYLDNLFKTQPIQFRLDSFLSGIIEIFASIPGIIIVVTLAALVGKKSTVLLIVILGTTSWPVFARLARAEVMRIKEKSFIESARVLGSSNSRIIWKHILLNALPALAVAIAFAIGSLILVESALSFLGIGVPDNTPTLGSLLRSGREHIEAWWLIVFPGGTIFLLIYLFNRIGDKISVRTNQYKG